MKALNKRSMKYWRALRAMCEVHNVPVNGEDPLKELEGKKTYVSMTYEGYGPVIYHVEKHKLYEEAV